MLAGDDLTGAASLYGYPGRLSVVGNDPADGGCFLWRTDKTALRRVNRGSGPSLLELACDVADLYHEQRPVVLPALPETALEVIWLELAADDSLLVFLKPCRVPDRLPERSLL